MPHPARGMLFLFLFPSVRSQHLVDFAAMFRDVPGIGLGCLFPNRIAKTARLGVTQIEDARHFPFRRSFRTAIFAVLRSARSVNRDSLTFIWKKRMWKFKLCNCSRQDFVWRASVRWWSLRTRYALDKFIQYCFLIIERNRDARDKLMCVDEVDKRR